MSIKSFGRELLSQFPMMDGLFRRFIWSRFHFPEVEMRFLNDLPAGSIDIAIDVGAAMGSYSWILNRVAKQVYSFEPGKIHNRYLNRVVFGTNIIVIRAACGSVSGKVSMYTPGSDSNARHSATLSQSNPVISYSDTSVDQVDQVVVDAFVAEKLSTNRSIDLLKVDVEGYELEVFKGSLEMLSKHHPLIVCEIEARHNANYAEVFGLLKKIGYSCYIYRAGTFESLPCERIEDLQSEDDLKFRLGNNYNPTSNNYINNFVFQHPLSRIKVKNEASTK